MRNGLPACKPAGNACPNEIADKSGWHRTNTPLPAYSNNADTSRGPWKGNGEMDRRFVVTVLSILLVTAGSIALATQTGRRPEARPLHETVSGVEQPPDSPEPVEPAEPAYAYVIKEYEGRVAVFTADKPDEPEIVYDTLVKYLPDYDRTQMREGIPVQDYKTLVALIEDYIS